MEEIKEGEDTNKIYNDSMMEEIKEREETNQTSDGFTFEVSKKKKTTKYLLILPLRKLKKVYWV